MISHGHMFPYVSKNQPASHYGRVSIEDSNDGVECIRITYLGAVKASEMDPVSPKGIAGTRSLSVSCLTIVLHDFVNRIFSKLSPVHCASRFHTCFGNFRINH